MKTFILLCLLAISASARYLKEGDQIDLTKYTGEWYEIARKNTYNIEACRCIKSRYQQSVLKPESLVYLSQCPVGSIVKTIKGLMTPLDQFNTRFEYTYAYNIFPAGIEISLNEPVPRGYTSDYLIVAIDPNYTWAVVSSKNKTSFFINSRTKTLDQATLNYIITQGRARGYPVDNLVFSSC